MTYLTLLVGSALGLWLSWRMFRPKPNPFARLARLTPTTIVAFAALVPAAASAIKAAIEFEEAMNRTLATIAGAGE